MVMVFLTSTLVSHLVMVLNNHEPIFTCLYSHFLVAFLYIKFGMFNLNISNEPSFLKVSIYFNLQTQVFTYTYRFVY